MKQRQNENLQNSIGGAVDDYAKSKEAKGFDLEKLAQQAVLKSEMGVKPSPDEEAAFNAYQKFEGAKVGIDPYTGQTYQKYRPFGMGGQEAPQGGFDLSKISNQSPGFAGGMIDTTQAMPDSFIGGTNDAVSPAPAPTGRLDVSMLSDALPKVGDTNSGEFLPEVAPKQSGFDLNNLPNPYQPATPENNLRLDSSLEGQSPRKAAEAKIDYQKDVQAKQAEATIKKQGEAPKAEAGYLSLMDKTSNIEGNIDKALSMVNPQTAGMGSSIKDIPIVGNGSKAKDLESILSTIQADSAFSSLQEMRDNSPTGGALGSISEGELKLLQNAAAALEQAQSPEQLKERLTEYKKVRQRALKRVGDAFEKQYGYRPQTEQAQPQSGAKSWEDYFPDAKR